MTEAEQPSALNRSIRAVRQIFGGGERYARAANTAATIERNYRSFRRKSRHMNETEKEDLLKETHHNTAKAIGELCRQNGAAWIKFAQFLSCRPDILPMEFILELQQLQAEAPSFHFRSYEPVISARLGDNWEDQFSEFNIIPVATASVAQVHYARLKNGDKVAIKFLLPGVKDLFEQDISLFKLVGGVLGPFVREVDINQIIDQLIKTTREELDFYREAENIKTFGSHQHIPGIHVPKLYEEMSDDKMIITSWAEGKPLTDFVLNEPEQAKPLLQLLMQSYLQQILQFGCYHADPHPGNFIVNSPSDITILDYGAIASLTQEETTNYQALIMCILGYSKGDLAELFAKAGFKGPDEDTLERIARLILDTMDENSSISDELSDVIEKLRRNRVVIPDSFVSIARALITVGGFLATNDVSFDELTW